MWSKIRTSKDLTGLKYGKLTVIGKSDTKVKQGVSWDCLCECGEIVVTSTGRLNSGHTKSCGCSRYKTPKDMSGLRFGNLIVLRKSNNKSEKGSLWNCRCDCGEELDVSRGSLVSGYRSSCGCKYGRSRFIDISGKRFGRLLVDGYIGRDKFDKILWRCICDCGNVTYLSKNSLNSGTTISCGCYRIDQISGANNPNWNPNLSDEERIENRDYKEYRDWRLAVFERDKYNCLVCDGGSGQLNVHHIFSHNKYVSLRLCVPNGVTLCETCHTSFHNAHGRGNNDIVQFANYLEDVFNVKINKQINDHIAECIRNVNSNDYEKVIKKVNDSFPEICSIINSIKALYSEGRTNNAQWEGLLCR